MVGRSRRLLVGLSVVVLAVGTLPPWVAAAEPTDFSATPLEAGRRVITGKSLSSRLAQTDPALLARNDNRPVQVMIKLDYDATASYAGGVDGLAATSPSVTGKPLTGNSAAERAYDRHVRDLESRVVRDLRAAVPSAEVGTKVRTVYGGFAATIPASTVERILRIDGVVAVMRDSRNQPLTDSSPDFIGADAAYDELRTRRSAGKGLIYGNLDTGIWPEHPSFADLGNLRTPPGPARECNYGDNPLTPANDPFVCQKKLIGGDHQTVTYDAEAAAGNATPDPYAGTARDGDGHGTHTSSTSAGNIVRDVEALGRDLPGIAGLAPGAWVIEYKVCGPDGCYDSDSARAVGQAIIDGVDVINFSISGGEQPYSDPVELAFLDAYAAGVFVSASAGNEGPGAGTANHLSPWTMTVAASTQTREFASTLTLTANNGDTLALDGNTITAGAGPLPVVLAQNVPGYAPTATPLQRAQCAVLPSSPSVFDGLIVGCQRGAQARVWKGFVVSQGGGEGMVLYNPVLQDTETDNHWVPTIHLAQPTAFLGFMNNPAHTSVTGAFPQGEAREGQGDVMAAFSSRGPAGLFIKPDVTAPGVQILAGASPTPPTPNPVDGGSPPGNYYQAIAGTSMSSPHVAGAALLVRAVHPDWTPGQVKSALMTTAVTDVLKEDLVTPADPFDLGAGRITVEGAIDAALAFDETAENFFVLGDEVLTSVHANLPSINAPLMPGRLVTTRTATNVSGERLRFEASAHAPDDASITVKPSRFSLRPGKSVELTITIESDAPVGAQRFGAVILDARGHDEQHLPVAFVHTQGSVSLTQDCYDDSIKDEMATTCTVSATNHGSEEQDVDLTTTTSRELKIVGAQGADVVGRHQPRAELHDVTLAGAQPGVPSVGAGDSPAGFLPLSLFSVTPDAIGDEEIINYGVPAFSYNGAEWDSVGVDSNGYLIVGGGTAEDNNCCNLPTGPDPERPNNVLAPFWTDLDGTGVAGISAAVLEAGADAWVVIEWSVNVFGSTDLRQFQVWLGIAGDASPGQDISFTYSAAQADPAGQAFLVGAENGLGEGDMEAVLPSDADQVVTSTDPVPGETASYLVIVLGRQRGTGVVRTEMDASGVPGTTIERSIIEVTRH